MFTLSTAYLLVAVENHVCVLKKRPDPSNGGVLRWTLPYNERCLCQGVVAPRIEPGHTCANVDDQGSTDDSWNLWFVDDYKVGPLTRRHNWNKEGLDDLLQRSEYCGMF